MLASLRSLRCLVWALSTWGLRDLHPDAAATPLLSSNDPCHLAMRYRKSEKAPAASLRSTNPNGTIPETLVTSFPSSKLYSKGNSIALRHCELRGPRRVRLHAH